ncbi:MAG: hypothetical protein ACLRVN_00115 [Butyricicoccus sp.]
MYFFSFLSCLSPGAEDESALFTAQNPIHFEHGDKAHHPRRCEPQRSISSSGVLTPSRTSVTMCVSS